MTEKTSPATESAETTEAAEIPVAEDLLVEEVSIDGMCGVY
ncbi:mycofactocin precursor MftA [Amycolatopsis sp. NPDC049252]